MNVQLLRLRSFRLKSLVVVVVVAYSFTGVTFAFVCLLFKEILRFDPTGLGGIPPIYKVSS